nr:hypothetical protein [uncultured bacterium]
MDHLFREAENAAAAWWAELGNASEASRERVGLVTSRIGGVSVVSVREDPTNFWSKAVGFTEPVTAGLVDEIGEFYRSAGCARAEWQILPELLPPDWAEICARHNLTPGGELARLASETLLTTATTDLRIGRITDAELWVATAFAAFGMSDGFTPVLLDFATDPANIAIGAWDGDKLAGVGSLYIRDEVAFFSSGATLPEYRNRGVQSALIAARAKTAEGCRLFVTDTAAEPNPSLRNTLRAGFRCVGRTQTWVWWRP